MNATTRTLTLTPEQLELLIEAAYDSYEAYHEATIDCETDAEGKEGALQAMDELDAVLTQLKAAR